MLFSQGSGDNTNRWSLYHDGTNLKLFVYTASSQIIAHSYAWSESTATWYHVALVRNGNNFDTYIDGTSLGQTVDTDSIGDYSGVLAIGSETDGESYFNGWMDEIRISGVARWTTSFTPPTEPYD